MCGHTRGPVIYSKFHLNTFRGFGASGGQNLAFPITLAIRFYNSLYYRTSRDEGYKMHHMQFLLGLRYRTRWVNLPVVFCINPVENMAKKNRQQTPGPKLSQMLISCHSYNNAIS